MSASLSLVHFIADPDDLHIDRHADGFVILTVDNDGAPIGGVIFRRGDDVTVALAARLRALADSIDHATTATPAVLAEIRAGLAGHPCITPKDPT